MNKSNNEHVLVVDLDGSLLTSDILHESFWSALSRNCVCLWGAILALFRGRAVLKRYLCLHSNVDVLNLPYNQEVIDYVRKHRSAGGKAILATASDQEFAWAIADHLQLFDEVFGSDGVRNLKGSSKASFLVQRFGADCFVYLGDSKADFSVWQVASKVVTVNAGQSMRKRAESMGKPFLHLGTQNRTVRPYIEALRPHQWLKNFLVLLPMLASHQHDATTVVSSIMALIAFSVVASSVYVLNDLLDLNSDRAHPRKRLRPLARGALPIAHASVLALSLLAVGILIAALISWKFLLTIAAYCALTTAYSLSLKREAIVDICLLAGLYTIRIFAGGVATDIVLSVWLFAFSIFFFFSLAAVKRQAELVDMADRGTLMAKGRGYHVNDLPILSIISLTSGYISVLVMALYVNSSEVRELYTLPDALLGICAVLLYWLSRMVLLTHRGFMHHDPVVFAATDRVSQVCFVIMLAFAVGGVLI